MSWFDIFTLFISGMAIGVGIASIVINTMNMLQIKDNLRQVKHYRRLMEQQKNQ